MIRRSFAVVVASMSLVVVAALPGTAGPRVPRFVTQVPFGAAIIARAVEGDGFAISRKDGSDVKGPLDLASMKITRGKGNDTIVFSNHGGVSNTAIDPDNGNFAILIDTNDDRNYDFGQYVFFAWGKLRGLLVNLRTNHIVDRTAPTSRANAKTFRTVIQRGKIDSPGTYRFAVFSYYQAPPCSKKHACIDAIPNRFPLIPLDHKAPSVSGLTLADFSTDASTGDGLVSPFSFDVADDAFGTRIKQWTVQRKEVGAGTGWKNVDSRKGTSPTVDVPGLEGTSFDVRVVVVDKQKNKKVSSTQRTSFPFDDRNLPAVTYSTGTLPVLGTPADAFLQTTSAVAQNETATLAFTDGSQVCVVGGPSGASATANATLDVGVPVALAEETSTSARNIFGCISVLGSGAHSLVVQTSSAEPFVIDGFYVIP
jgi:hypothetical protein